MRLHACLLVALASCAEPVQSPPPQTPRGPSPEEQANNAALANMQRAQVEAANVQAAQLDAMQKNATAAQAARDEQAKAERERQAHACAASRHDRAEHAKGIIAARLQAETRLLTNAKAIRAACKLGAKPTGAATISRSGSSWRVAPELADDVQCSKLPSGVTKDDAYVVLWRVKNEGGVEPHGKILQPEDRSPDDDTCRPFDKEAGVDFDAITYDDLSSTKTLEGK